MNIQLIYRQQSGIFDKLFPKIAFPVLIVFLGTISLISITLHSNYAQGIEEKSLFFSHEFNITSSNGTSKLPQITINGNDVYVVWQDNSTGNYDIFFTHSSDNGSSFDPVRSLSNNSGNSEQPQIAAQGSNIYVVWQDNSTGNYDIFFTRSLDKGNSFKPVRSLSNNSGTSEQPQIAAQGSNIYVVWQDNSTGNYDIFFKRSLSNGTKFNDHNVSKNNGTSQLPQLAAQRNNVYVVWQDNTPGNYDILFKRSSNGGSGFKTVHLENTIGTSILPKVELDGNEVYVVWQDNTSGSYDIYLQRSLSNGTKFASRNISNNNGTSERPQISVLNGETYISWRDNERGIFDVFFRHGKKDSVTGRNQFGPSYILDSKGEAGNPTLSTGSEFLYGVWISFLDKNKRSVLEFYPFMLFGDSGNSIPLTRLSANQSISNLDVAVSGKDVFIVWDGIEKGNGNIFFKKISAGTF